MSIRIAIVDDQRLFRAGMKMILGGCEECAFVFEAKDGEQFFQRLAYEPVDVVLLDIEMPGMDGIATLERIREKHPDLKVLMLTMHNSERLINHLMQLGANGYLLKDEDAEVVLEGVRSVHRDGMFFRDYVSKALLKGGRVKKGSSPFSPKLTDRELEILLLLCQEKSNKEIGEELFLSSRTVEGHRRSLLDKIGAKNLAGLVKYAVKEGLL